MKLPKLPCKLFYIFIFFYIYTTTLVSIIGGLTTTTIYILLPLEEVDFPKTTRVYTPTVQLRYKGKVQ